MPSATLGDVFRALQQLESEGTVERYAVVGAIAALFYAEATPTFDLDVAVVVPQPGGSPIFSLDALYRALRERGFGVEGAHVMIHGVPVQFLPGDEGLWRETVSEARTLDYEGTPVRIATPEHLVAMAWSAAEPKRLQRAMALLVSPGFNRDRLREILVRHGIPDRTPDHAR